MTISGIDQNLTKKIKNDHFSYQGTTHLELTISRKIKFDLDNLGENAFLPIFALFYSHVNAKRMKQRRL